MKQKNQKKVKQKNQKKVQQKEGTADKTRKLQDKLTKKNTKTIKKNTKPGDIVDETRKLQEGLIIKQFVSMIKENKIYTLPQFVQLVQKDKKYKAFKELQENPKCKEKFEKLFTNALSQVKSDVIDNIEYWMSELNQILYDIQDFLRQEKIREFKYQLQLKLLHRRLDDEFSNEINHRLRLIDNLKKNKFLNIDKEQKENMSKLIYEYRKIWYNDFSAKSIMFPKISQVLSNFEQFGKHKATNTLEEVKSENAYSKENFSLHEPKTILNDDISSSSNKKATNTLKEVNRESDVSSSNTISN